jgi:hypothetical protein
MLKNEKEYLIFSKDVDGRLNNLMERFEFIILVNSMKSLVNVLNENEKMSRHTGDSARDTPAYPYNTTIVF